MSDERWLKVAAAILDGSDVSWDVAPPDRGADDPHAIDALRLIADVARAHQTDRWGPFELLEKIGHGTFGDVYRVRDTALDRDVALKLLANAPISATLEEGKLLARVRHPNVVMVHGAGTYDGRYGIWMEFVRGRTLAAIVEEHGPLQWRDVATIGADLCAALAAVHAGGLLHGDVKARNVMRENGGRIVLMDFGTGRFAADPTSRISGTPLYIAPELLDGRSPDVRSDVYSAGVLLYYLLTGEYPVEGSTLEAVRAAHKERRHVSVGQRQGRCPRTLADIIDRAISCDPAGRFPNVGLFEASLRRALGGSPQSARVGWYAAGLVILVLSGIEARAWIPSRPSTLASMVETLVRSVPARGRSDLAGSWNDSWTEGLCGYACGTPPGHGGATTLIVTSDSETTFHGTYGVFPITGTVSDSSISFAWKNYPTWAGIAQGACKGTASAKSMWLTCSEFIAPPSGGLLLNGTNNDQLTKATPSGLAITSVLDPPPYLNVGQPLHSFTLRVVYMNRGNSPSTTALAEFFLSGSGSTRDVFLGNAALPALSSYDVGSVTSLVGANRMPPLGKYFLLACIGTECRRSTGQVLVGGPNRHKTNDGEHPRTRTD